MKLVLSVAVAALITAAACKKKDEAKPSDPAKTAEPAKPADPGATAPAPTPKPPEPAPEPVAKADPPAAPVESFKTIDEAATALFAMLDKIKAAVLDAKGDCAKMGASLKALTPEFKQIEERGKALENDPAKDKEFEQKYAKRVEKHANSWLPAAQKCEDNEDIKEFFSVME